MHTPTVYHGTDAVFAVFDARTIGKRTGCDTAGFWFASSKQAAGFFGERTIAARLTIRRPRYVTEAEFLAGHPRGPSHWARLARAEGCDGVIFVNIQDGDIPSTVYVVFEPAQIAVVPTRTRSRR